MVLAHVVVHQLVARADSSANRVLGQVDFVHNSPDILTNVSLWNPQSVAVDHSVVPNRLYVADSGNHRILGWRSIEALTNGSPADVVIGQGDFLSWLSQCNNAAVTGATFCVPGGIAVDGAGNLYVVDVGNNRVLEYDIPFTTDAQPDLVFGQAGSFTTSACNKGGISAASLCGPTAVAVDDADNVYLSDTGNNRVLEFDMPLVTDVNADRVFGQFGSFSSATRNAGGVSANSLSGPTAVAVDTAGNLYVADNSNFRALEYNTPVASKNTTADLVFGQAGSFNSNANGCVPGPGAGNLCTPAGLGTDNAGNLYISDSSFSRILEYDDPVGSKNTTADAVFGQPDFSTALCNSGALGPGSLCLPSGLALDPVGDLFAADFGNQRLLMYTNPLATHPPNTDAVLALGQSALNRNGVNGAKAAGLYWPAAAAVDVSATPNRLYVADTNNSRVLAWHSVPAFVNGAPADLVIGQSDLLSAGCNQNRTDAAGNPLAAADTLCLPQGVAVDPSGNLYVADSNNFRVLGYSAPFSSGKSAGLSSDLVLGQHGSFTSRVSNNGGVSASSMSAPAGVAVDQLARLYVTDPLNNRVLEYNHPTTAASNADAVFGQGGSLAGSLCNFNGGCHNPGCAATAQSLCGPTAVAVDGANNVYIADSANNRVLQYISPLMTAPTPNVVIGQSNFTSVVCGTLCQPQGVAADARGNLFAADPLNARVTEYNAPLVNGAPPNLTIGNKQCDQASAQAGTLCGVSGLALDSGGNLYAADTLDSRVLEYNQPIVPPTPTPTPRLTPTPRPTRTPSPTPTPVPGAPFISSIPSAILAGSVFTIRGHGFTLGSRVNFFVATAAGPINTGPFTPSFNQTQLKVLLPATNPLGAGVAAVQVVNTDQGFVASNSLLSLLQGNPAVGIPSITAINSTPISPNSTDPGIAVANVATVVQQGMTVTVGGMGFDAANGVAVDVFCACTGGKVGPFIVGPGLNLASTSVSFVLPASGANAPPTGPGSFVVINKGADGGFGKSSNAVSVPIGQRVAITSVSQGATTVTVNGAGFSTLTVINLFNLRSGVVVNLGGFSSNGAPRIPLKLVSSNVFTFTVPAAAVPGQAYVQALNPPFVPFSSSGNSPSGSFILH